VTMAVVEIGAQIEPRSFGPLTKAMFVRYAGASGDFNPMHYDEEFASKAGFPTVFAHGMLQAAFLATFATDWLGAENIRRFHVRFREQVWPGDVLTCTGKITGIEESPAGNVVSVDLTGVRQPGSVVITGSADFVVD
jgi:acyl dehydratase